MSNTPNLDDVRSGILAVRVANATPESKNYEEKLGMLKESFAKTGLTMIGQPQAFYKSEVKNAKTLAGCVIKVQDKDMNESLMVSYHGTRLNNLSELKSDIHSTKASKKFGDKTLDVHKGFLNEYESSKEQLIQILGQQMGTDKKLPITFSGHSLGGAVAQIAAFDLQSSGKIESQDTKVLTYGSPRVFGKEAAIAYNNSGLGKCTLLIRQSRDIIPKVPPALFYAHAGYKVRVPNASPVPHGGPTYRKATNRLDSLKPLSGQEHSKDKLGVIRETDLMNPAFVSSKSYLVSVLKLTKNQFVKALNVAKSKTASIATNLINKIWRSSPVRTEYDNKNLPQKKTTKTERFI